MLIDAKIFKFKYKSKDAVIKALDSNILKDIRLRAQTSRNRKDKYIITIKKAQGKDIDTWNFGLLVEYYLEYVAAIYKIFTYKKAVILI